MILYSLHLVRKLLKNTRRALSLIGFKLFRKNPKGFKKNLQTAKSERDVNGIRAWAKTKKLAEVDKVFSCDSCNASYATRQQLALHSFYVHGARWRLRDYVDTDFCPVCLQLFHSRINVINHLVEKSLRCRLLVCTVFGKLPREIVDALDEDDAKIVRELTKSGRRCHHTSAYVERLTSPLIKAAIVAGLSHKTLLKTPSALLDDDAISRLEACRGS